MTMRDALSGVMTAALIATALLGCVGSLYLMLQPYL